MGKKSTTTHSKDGHITGKTVTERFSDGSKNQVNYSNTGSNILGPNYKAETKTHTDSKGNTRTKSY